METKELPETTEQYMDAADKINSGLYFGDRVGVEELKRALDDFIIAAQALDKYKKVLFRGRTREVVGLDRLLRERLVRDYIKPQDADMLHGAIGIFTEAGEIAEALYKEFEGEPADKVNFLEEVGDLLWYINRILRWAGSNFLREMRRNISKLTGRHGETFNAERDVNRDLSNEREILESE